MQNISQTNFVEFVSKLYNILYLSMRMLLCLSDGKQSTANSELKILQKVRNLRLHIEMRN